MTVSRMPAELVMPIVREMARALLAVMAIFVPNLKPATMATPMLAERVMPIVPVPVRALLAATARRVLNSKRATIDGETRQIL